MPKLGVDVSPRPRAYRRACVLLMVNIEKGWRKIIEKRLFLRYLKMTKIIKNIPSSVFPLSEINIAKGQIISKRFFLAEDSSEKRTKTRRILVKMNSFVRFLEELTA